MEGQYANEHRQLGPWEYFGLSVLYHIPLVGWIFLVVHAVSNKKITRRNFARHYFCEFLVLLVLLMLCMATIYGMSGGTVEDSVRWVEQQVDIFSFLPNSYQDLLSSDYRLDTEITTSQTTESDTQEHSEPEKASIGKEITLVDQDGVKVTLTGTYEIKKDYFGDGSIIFFDSVVENNTNTVISLGKKAAIVNGWNTDLYANGSKMVAGTKSRETMGFDLSVAGIHTIDEIDSLQVNLYVLDVSDYRELFSTGLIDIPLHSNSDT